MIGNGCVVVCALALACMCRVCVSFPAAPSSAEDEPGWVEVGEGGKEREREGEVWVGNAWSMGEEGSHLLCLEAAAVVPEQLSRRGLEEE